MPDETTYLAFEAPIVAEIDTSSALRKLNNLRDRAKEVSRNVESAFKEVGYAVRSIQTDTILAHAALDALGDKSVQIQEKLNGLKIGKIEVGTIDTGGIEEKIAPLAQKLADLSGAAWNIADKTKEIITSITYNLESLAQDVGGFTEILNNSIRKIEEAEIRVEELRRAREGLVEIDQTEYDRLQQQNDALRENEAALSNTVHSLRERIQAQQNWIKSVEDSWERQRREKQAQEEAQVATEKTTKSVNELAIALKRLMEDPSINVVGAIGGTITEGFGTFQKGIGFARKTLGALASELMDSGKTAQETYEEIVKTIETLLPVISARTNRETDAIMKAWSNLARELVFGSIIPDMMDAIEKQMVDRMKEILDKHAKAVEAFTLPGTGIDPDEITGLYKKAINALQEEQIKFDRGVYEQQKEAGRIIEDTIKEAVQGIDQFVYGIDFDRLVRELQRRGGQLAAVSVKIKEEILGEHAKLVKELFFIDKKPQDVEALSKAYNQVLQAIVDEQELIRKKIIEKPIGTERIIRNMVEPFKNLREEYLRAYRDIVKTDWSKLSFADVEKRIAAEGKTIIDVIHEVNEAWAKLAPQPSIGDSIVSFFSRITTSISSSVQQIPGILQEKLVNGITNAMARLPINTQYYIIEAVNSIRKAGDLFGSAMGSSIQAIKDRSNLSDILGNWKPFVSEMGQIGRDAGSAIVEGLKNQIQLSSVIVQDAVIKMAQSAGNRMKAEFLYAMGGVADILSFKGPADRLRNAIARAQSLGLEGAFATLEEERIKRGIDLQNSSEEFAHIMQVTEQSATESLKNIGVAFQNLFSGEEKFGTFVKTLSTGLHQLDRSFGAGVEGANDLSSAVARAVGIASRQMGGYRRENEILDASLQRLAKTSDNMGDTLKTQAQEYIKLTQTIRSSKIEQGNVIANWLQTYEALVKAEQGLDKTTESQERLNRAQDKFVKASQKLSEVGLAEEVFARQGEHMERLKEEALAAGKALDTISLSDKFVTAAEDAEQITIRLADEIESYTRNYPKLLSMFNRAVQDFEGQSKHFFTTLRDGGKISTENLQDMRLAYENMAKEMANIEKLNLLKDPEALEFWRQLQRQVLLGAENFGIMARRALVVQQVKEKLYGTTRRVITGIQELGREAARHIPIIGEKAKLSEEQMNRLKTATQTARGQTQSIALALGDLDPAFQGMIYGVGEMGRSFSSTMDGMRQVAEVKSGSIIKALTAMKIAMLGIIGIFGSIIISTGKLAAEVTTLGMTMEVVGKNIGYNTKYLWQQVDALEATGITTREAINTVTQFMRSGLPMQWFDPFKDANVQLTDLARNVQEIAVAMGENSSESLGRVIDFINTGNSQLLNQLGIMKNASKMLEEYAAAVGKDVKALSEMEQKQALMIGIMKEATVLQGTYTAAMETASKQLGSMTRYIEQLRLEYGKYFEPIIVFIVKRFNELLIALKDLSPEMKQTITNFIALATAFAGIALALQTVIPLAGKFIGLFRPFVSLLLGKFGLLIAAAGLVGKALYDVFMKIPAESEGIAGVIERVDTLLESFGGIVEVLRPVQDWIRSFATMVKDHFDYIYYRIKTFVANISKRLQDFREENPEILDFLQRARKVLSDLFTVVWRVVDKVLRGIELLLSGNWEGFFDNLKIAGKYILAFMLEFFNEVIISAFNWGKNIITSFVNGLVTQARTIIPRVMIAIGQMISVFLEGHSPAKFGPLSKVDIWGEGIMEGFARGMLNRKILFNEDMFQGLSGLRGKAKLWGDNIIEVFTAGITGKAATAIGPAMGQVGAMIARFLEGHSPPEAGRLADIMDWGRNIFETFLAGFEQADFGVLDKALELVRRRLDILAGDAENAGKKVAKAMLKAREIVAGAIAEARSTGGALDLSALDKFMKDSFKSFGQDIGAVVSALFEAMKAEAVYKDLQDKISKAREARDQAIATLEEEYGLIEKQVEVEAKNRARLKGLIYNEALTKELERQLEEANADVAAAQRRINSVRGQSRKYGINILTWEEINAQAQLELAERRRDEIQSQVSAQEQIQREIERVRDEVQAEYQAQLDSLTAQIESLKAINEATTKQEDATLAAAEENYNQLKERSDYLANLLEQRLKYEEEVANANRKIVDETAKAAKSLKEKIDEIEIEPIEGEFEIPPFTDLLVGPLAKIAEDIDGSFKSIQPPDFTELFDRAFDDLIKNILPGFDLSGGLVGFANEIREKISLWWNDLKETKFGTLLEEIGLFSFVETISEEFGEILGSIQSMIDATSDFIEWLKTAEGESGFLAGFMRGVANFFKFAFKLGEGVVIIISEALQIFAELTTVIPKLLTGMDFGEAISSTLQEGLDFLGEMAGVFTDLIIIIGDFFNLDIKGSEIVEAFDFFREAISTVFKSIPKIIEKAMLDIWDKLVGVWEKIWDVLLGRSIIPDIVDGIVEWFTDLPKKLLRLVSDMFRAAVELGKGLYNGIASKVFEIVSDVVEWFLDVIDSIGTTAKDFYNKAVEIGKEVFNGFKEKIDDIVDNVVSWFGMIGTNIFSTAATLAAQALAVGLSVYNGFKGKIDEIINNVVSWFVNIGSSIASTATTLWNNAVTVGQQVFDAFKSKITEIINNVAMWFINIGTNIVNTGWTLWNNAVAVGQRVYNGFKSKIDSIINNVVSWFGTVADTLLDAGEYLWEKASSLAINIYNAFYNMIFGEEGLVAKISGWIKSVAAKLGAGDLLTEFYKKAWDIGGKIITGIKDALGSLASTVVQKIKDIWNTHLKTPFQGVINSVAGAINGIIDLINDAAATVGLDLHINPINPPILPSLDTGGIVTQDVIARLHAGEIVLPLDRLESILRNMNMPEPIPAFSPIMNFYPGSSPQQVMPAIHQAYDWYTEVSRRG